MQVDQDFPHAVREVHHPPLRARGRGDDVAALGADRKTIVDDFSLSNDFYAPYVKTLSERVARNGGGLQEITFIRSMIGVSVENFERTLDLIDNRYGSLAAYLEKALGFTAREQELLRDKYLTRP